MKEIYYVPIPHWLECLRDRNKFLYLTRRFNLPVSNPSLVRVSLDGRVGTLQFEAGGMGVYIGIPPFDGHHYMQQHRHIPMDDRIQDYLLDKTKEFLDLAFTENKGNNTPVLMVPSEDAVIKFQVKDLERRIYAAIPVAELLKKLGEEYTLRRADKKTMFDILYNLVA